MRSIPNIIKGLGAIAGALLHQSEDSEHNPNYPRTPIWNNGERDPAEEIYEIEEEYPIVRQGAIEGVDYPSRRKYGAGDLEPYIEVGDEEPNLDVGGLKNIETEISVKGIDDVLGWYRSFHTGDPKWGVHVTVSGMIYLASRVFRSLPAPYATKILLGFQAICDHELFHFANDYAVAQAELALNEPWWTVAKPIHQSGLPGYSILEERLANSYMLKAFLGRRGPLNIRGKKKAITDFVSKQPIGYNQGTIFYGNQWDREVHGLAHEYGKHSRIGSRSAGLWSLPSGFDWPAIYQIHPRVDFRYCPIYLVHDGARLGVPTGWLSFFACIPNIEETETFAKYRKKLASPIVRAWERTKDKLQTRIMPGADFKKWPKEGPNIWSVRVDQGYRAHLEHLKDQNRWNALKIGTHTEMGHD